MSNSEGFSLDDIGVASDTTKGFDDLAGIGEEKDSQQEGSGDAVHDMQEAHDESEHSEDKYADDELLEDGEDFDAGAIDKKPFWKTNNGIIAIGCGVAILGYLGIQGPKMMQNGAPQQAVPTQQQLISEANNTPQPMEGAQPPVIDNLSSVVSGAPDNAQAPSMNPNQVASAAQPSATNQAAVNVTQPQQPVAKQLVAATLTASQPEASASAENAVKAFPEASASAENAVKAFPEAAQKIADLEAKLAAANTQISFIVAEIKSKNAMYEQSKANWKKANKELTGKLEKLTTDHAALSKKVAGISWRVTRLRKAAKKTPKTTASAKEHYTIKKFKITGFTDDESWIYSERTKRTFSLSVGVPLKDFGKVISVGPDKVVFSKGGVIRP